MSATTSSMKKSRKIIFRDFLSAAELADLVLNEPACRVGGGRAHRALWQRGTWDASCGNAR